VTPFLLLLANDVVRYAAIVTNTFVNLHGLQIDFTSDGLVYTVCSISAKAAGDCDCETAEADAEKRNDLKPPDDL